MRTYYLFRINESFYNLYCNKTFYLYKMLEEISKSSENDFKISYRLFNQIAIPYNKSYINSLLYKKYMYNNNYEKILDKHKLIDEVERTKLTVFTTYIKVKSNKNIPVFFKDLKDEINVFVCDFNNKDYFFLNKVISKSLV